MAFRNQTSDATSGFVENYATLHDAEGRSSWCFSLICETTLEYAEIVDFTLTPTAWHAHMPSSPSDVEQYVSAWGRCLDGHCTLHKKGGIQFGMSGGTFWSWNTIVRSIADIRKSISIKTYDFAKEDACTVRGENSTHYKTNPISKKKDSVMTAVHTVMVLWNIGL